MKVLWTLLKVVIALVVAIPLSIIVLATAVGILGALVGIAVLALKLVVFGLVGWAAFRLVARLVRGPAPDSRKSAIAELSPGAVAATPAIRGCGASRFSGPSFRE